MLRVVRVRNTVIYCTSLIKQEKGAGLRQDMLIKETGSYKQKDYYAVWRQEVKLFNKQTLKMNTLVLFYMPLSENQIEGNPQLLLNNVLFEYVTTLAEVLRGEVENRLQRVLVTHSVCAGACWYGSGPGVVPATGTAWGWAAHPTQRKRDRGQKA